MRPTLNTWASHCTFTAKLNIGYTTLAHVYGCLRLMFHYLSKNVSYENPKQIFFVQIILAIQKSFVLYPEINRRFAQLICQIVYQTLPVSKQTKIIISMYSSQFIILNSLSTSGIVKKLLNLGACITFLILICLSNHKLFYQIIC